MKKYSELKYFRLFKNLSLKIVDRSKTSYSDIYSVQEVPREYDW